MPRLVGLHSITVRKIADRQAFEEVMTSQVFDEAADVPGSVFRGGRSMIKSQHLLSSIDGLDYQWLVKADESLDHVDTFRQVLRRMYDDSREDIEKHAELRSTSVYVVRGSFDAGPRNVTGGPLGEGERGDFI